MLMPDMLVDFATSNKLLSFIDSHLRHAQIFIIKEDFSSCCEKKRLNSNSLQSNSFSLLFQIK